MTRLLVVFALAASGLALGPATPADAYHDPCGGYVGPAELGVEGQVIEIPAEPLGTYYLDMRFVAEDLDHLYSVWIYQESNGNEGLQRGGNNCDPVGCPSPEGWPDPCQESAHPDLLIL